MYTAPPACRMLATEAVHNDANAHSAQPTWACQAAPITQPHEPGGEGVLRPAHVGQVSYAHDPVIVRGEDHALTCLRFFVT